MDLYIDATDFNAVVYALKSPNSILKKVYKIDPHKSHTTIAKLEVFLKSAKVKNPEVKIKKIIVNKGPGSYTGTRVGVTHALALGFAWEVPVKFLARDKFNLLLA
jgi:tRNA A37 threonylcarbamoyladenosine modification protein TsaB